jgi:uncharacterized membrane protein YcaP (DUF421 family)
MTVIPRAWPTWLAILVSVPAGYVSLLVVLRVAGKRTLSKLTVYGLCVTVAFGSLFASVVVNRSLPLGDGILAFALLAGLQTLVGWWSTRSDALRRVVTARPTLLVRLGRVDANALRRERLRLADVHAAVRGSGHASVTEVLAVVLETDGSISVVGGSDRCRPTDALDAIEGWTDP